LPQVSGTVNYKVSGTVNYKKIKEQYQWSSEGDVKQVPYLGPTNIRQSLCRPITGPKASTISA